MSLAPNTTGYRRAPTLGPSRVLTITHPTAEGIFVIDEGTGGPLTPLQDVPEWAAHLANAMLSERMKFYIDRVGIQAAAPLISQKAIEVGDLEWVAMIEDEQTKALKETLLEADKEVRTGILSGLLGISTAEADGLVQIKTDAHTREIIESWDKQPVTLEEAKATTESLAGAGKAFKEDAEREKRQQQGSR